MMCPSCTKEFSGTVTCPRCGCEVSQLQDIASGSRVLAARAIRSLRCGEFRTSINQAAASWNLYRTIMAAEVALLSSVALDDKETALRWLECCQNLTKKA